MPVMDKFTEFSGHVFGLRALLRAIVTFIAPCRNRAFVLPLIGLSFVFVHEKLQKKSSSNFLKFY